MKIKTMKKVFAVALAVAFISPIGLPNSASAAKHGGAQDINETPVAEFDKPTGEMNATARATANIFLMVLIFIYCPLFVVLISEFPDT